MRLTVSLWIRSDVDTREIDEPSAADVLAALGDGQSGIEVSLGQVEPFAYVTVSGGPDLYLVTGETPDGKILLLTDPGTGDEQISLVTGGQLAEYARRNVAMREAATQVLLRFLEHADYDPDLPWDIQD